MAKKFLSFHLRINVIGLHRTLREENGGSYSYIKYNRGRENHRFIELRIHGVTDWRIHGGQM